MHDRESFNFQNKVLYIEHALRNIHNKQHNHSGCSIAVENLTSKYVNKDKQLDFLDALLRLIINPGEQLEFKGKCKLIELALCEHFNKKNYSRYYGDASIVQDLTIKYVDKDKQLDFLDALLKLFNV